eukprot:SAG31_NODE_14185_length_823_cov_0.662983_2_plen_69_part_00
MGAKRWTLYPGDPSGIPPAVAYNRTAPHMEWIENVYQTVRADARARPLPICDNLQLAHLLIIVINQEL